MMLSIAYRWEFGKTRPQPTKMGGPLDIENRVGEPFRPGRQDWPEGAQLIFGPRGPELTIFHRERGDDLVDDVRQGPAEFALIVELPVIVLAYRFGHSIPWSNVPYSWHLQPELRRVIPPELDDKDGGAQLWITMVGATDGIILAKRVMTLSPAFTRSLYEAIRTQATTEFDAMECTAVISNLYLSKTPTVDLLARATARSIGNA